MGEAMGFPAIDGVLYVDVLALKAVVAATGPIELEGVQYTSKNIAQQMMNENYIRFSNPDEQDPRYDLQSRMGVAAFDALNSRPIDLGALVSRLTAAGKRPQSPRLVGRFCVAARMAERGASTARSNPNGLQVNIENISANKLDWYVKPKVALKTQWVRRGVAARRDGDHLHQPAA